MSGENPENPTAKRFMVHVELKIQIMPLVTDNQQLICVTTGILN